MTIFTDKAKVYVPRLMKDLNLTRIQACGLFGNLGTETGGFTALQEKAPIIKGSRGGYGWMQWTGPRRRKYEAWCQTNSLNPAVDETNYKYLVQESLTDEAHSITQLRKTTSIEAAAETFMKQNLRPGIPHLESRIKYAKEAERATFVYVAETPKEVEKREKEDKQIGVVAAVGLIGTILAFLTNHPIITLSLAAAVGLGAWWLIKWYQEQKETEQKEKLAAIAAAKTPKKRKKNGKKN